MIRFSRFIFASLLASVLFFAGCSAITGPSAAVKKFYRLVEKGNVEQAADMFSTESISMFGRDKLVAGLTEQTRDISRKGGVDKIDILSEDVQGQVAEIRALIVYGNGETQDEEIQLTKLDGEWKLTPTLDK